MIPEVRRQAKPVFPKQMVLETRVIQNPAVRVGRPKDCPRILAGLLLWGQTYSAGRFALAVTLAVTAFHLFGPSERAAKTTEVHGSFPFSFESARSSNGVCLEYAFDIQSTTRTSDEAGQRGIIRD
jgi:hypothetical protein